MLKNWESKDGKAAIEKMGNPVVPLVTPAPPEAKLSRVEGKGWMLVVSLESFERLPTYVIEPSVALALLRDWAMNYISERGVWIQPRGSGWSVHKEYEPSLNAQRRRLVLTWSGDYFEKVIWAEEKEGRCVWFGDIDAAFIMAVLKADERTPATL